MELPEKISRAQRDERVTSGRCRVAYDQSGRIQFVTDAQWPEFEQRGYTLAAKPTAPPVFAPLDETTTEPAPAKHGRKAKGNDV